MQKKASPKITHAEYEQILPMLKNISVERKRAAYARLVEGKTFQSIADEFSWSRPSVYQAAKAVMAKYEEYQEALKTRANSTTLLPPGWERVDLIAPAHLIEKFRAEIAEAEMGKDGAQSKKIQSTENKKKPDSK